MTHISGFERSQLLLLPEAVDDYVGADNPVRFIDAFVGGLDLAAAGFKRVTPKATGRPGYGRQPPISPANEGAFKLSRCVSHAAIISVFAIAVPAI